MFRKPLLVRMAIILILGGLLASFSLIPAAVSAQSTTYIPVVDGYVSASNPATNYGTGTTLRVDASPRTVSYLRFNVAGLAGQKVTQALLKIYANSASTQGLVAKSVSDDNWGETTLNYNNAPAMGSTLASSGAVPAGKWITLDVTAYITGSGMFSIGVTTPGSTAISLAARESGTKAPQLVVTTDIQPIPTSTQQPTSSKTATTTRTKNHPSPPQLIPPHQLRQRHPSQRQLTRWFQLPPELQPRLAGLIGSLPSPSGLLSITPGSRKPGPNKVSIPIPITPPNWDITAQRIKASSNNTSP